MHIKLTHAHLRQGKAQLRRLLVPIQRFLHIDSCALPFLVNNTQCIEGIDKALLSRELEPLDPLGLIALDAIAAHVAEPELELRLGLAESRAFFVPLHRRRVILMMSLTTLIAKA